MTQKVLVQKTFIQTNIQAYNIPYIQFALPWNFNRPDIIQIFHNPKKSNRSFTGPYACFGAENNLFWTYPGYAIKNGQAKNLLEVLIETQNDNRFHEYTNCFSGPGYGRRIINFFKHYNLNGLINLIRISILQYNCSRYYRRFPSSSKHDRCYNRNSNLRNCWKTFFKYKISIL